MAYWSEGKVEQYLRKAVDECGGICVKNTDHRGALDRLVLLPNVPPVFVECKSQDGTLTRLQVYEMTRLQDLRFRTRVVRSKADVDTLMDDIMALARGEDVWWG